MTTAAAETPAPKLNLTEAAARVGVIENTLRKWVFKGKVKATRNGLGRLMFDPAELDALMQGQPVAPKH